MSPMIPDCGVLTTPRRSPPIKLNGEDTLKSPKMATLPYRSPPYPSDKANVTLDTGFSFSFYKSPKLPTTPVRRVEPQPEKVRGIRRPKDSINKGVGHKIKKPKPKSKELKMKKRTVKTTMKSLKEGNYTPCPWIPSNRSPLKKRLPAGSGKKKHVLSSPGISLLEEESSQDEVQKTEEKKFFTSRSRASATVNISKNVLLAAKNGDIVLKQREGPFEKKNVGRAVEEELEKYIKSSSLSHNSESLEEPPCLPSVKANPRPMPTRVPSTPSPPKRKVSPRKAKKLFNAKSFTLLSNNNTTELQDLEVALQDIEVDKKQTDPEEAKENENGMPTRRSPRKLYNGSSTPVKESPLKGDRFSSPVRRSPRNNGSPTRTPTRHSTAKSLSVTPRKTITPKKSSTELTFAEVAKGSPRRNTPTKATASPRRATPSKRRVTESDLCEGSEGTPKKRSPRKPVEKGVNSSYSDEVSCSTETTGSTSGDAASSSKLYPLFDRKNWRPDLPSPKTPRSCHRHLGKQKLSHSQLIIDAGQKEFGARQCLDCGVVYEIANQEDEASHRLYHNAVDIALKFMGWKNENMVSTFDEHGGRVIMVSSNSPAFCWRKVEEVLKIVDDELGFSEKGNLVKENSHAFLYVMDQKIVGCLIGERINKANRVIPSKTQVQSSNRLLCCSQEQFRVVSGVSRLWVLSTHRGKGIATKLTDAMRCNMVTHHILSKDDIAFSDPTESGTQFAEKYTNRRDFLVYRR